MISLHLKVYCMRSGQLEVSTRLPKGALHIADIFEVEHLAAVDVCARHDRTSAQLLVPGLPEAGNDQEAHHAVIMFADMLHKRGLPVCLPTPDAQAAMAASLLGGKA